jgi:hypothetical protein
LNNNNDVHSHTPITCKAEVEMKMQRSIFLEYKINYWK